MRITPSLASKPSISTSNWLRVCSRSSCPPPRPAPRCRPTASISSMKIMQGACFFPWTNKSRTREAPTPTNISTKSEPLMEKNGTPASPAIARASSVLPVPGAPTNNTPLGIRPPKRDNFFEFLLRFLDTGDIAEGDTVLIFCQQLGPALTEGHGLAAPHLHLPHEENPDANQQ